ncbi:MAG TPA: glycoside hydrolase family 127 protein [Firmicutes bacterium]|nr:glycoside hydrolase family 127 protein [Candidatus Fermentithermobacillaceae bacterium]
MALPSLRPVDLTKVALKDSFWAPRLEINRQVTVKSIYKQLKDTGRLDSLDPDYKRGDRNAHHIFWDSDVAKWIEAASYTLALYRDPDLERQIDEAVDRFARLQRPDGYLNSWFTKVEPDKRWTNLRDKHEMYCAGHLMEAAVAYYRATGKKKFLDIVSRYADHIDSIFGPENGKLRGYPGHEEIELALVKLYRATGNERYLRLAKFFIDERGQQPHYYDAEAKRRGEDPSWRNYEYQQAHIPVRQQKKVVGHAVRAMYLYSGMADVARETGDNTLLEACKALWQDLTSKHLYITGGIGQTGQNEGFTFEYDLPEESAYCETCAAIGLVFWSHRMLQLEKDRRYADVMERALYNGTISGWSLSGDRFFYVNPLASRGDHHRQEWFRCACCPPNISRLVASLGNYIYSESDTEAWVHLYVQGEAELEVGGKKVRISQKTNYPWDGQVELTLEPESPQGFTVALRIPGWCRKAVLRVNGEEVDIASVTVAGYARVERVWQPGDKIFLDLSMPVERVKANPRVRALNGKVAIQRGPVVYCLEETDNRVKPLTRIILPKTSQLIAEYRQDLLGGVVVITSEAQIDCTDWEDELYQQEPLESLTADTRPFRITAVPYCVWDNREPGEMTVWLREC